MRIFMHAEDEVGPPAEGEGGRRAGAPLPRRPAASIHAVGVAPAAAQAAFAPAAAGPWECSAAEPGCVARGSYGRPSPGGTSAMQYPRLLAFL